MNSRRKVEGGGGFPFIIQTLSNISLVCDADRQNRIRLFSRGTAGKAATVTPMPCSRQYREKYLQGNQTIKLPTQIKQLMRYTYVYYIILAWYFSHTRLCIYRLQTCVLTNSHWWLGETYTTFAGANVTMGTTGDSLFPYTIKPISCNRLRKYLVFHFSWLILFMPSQNKKKCSELQKTTNVEEKNR